MLTVFFFARLWRRAGIVTDVEFAELRYTGRMAAFLRGFRALYLGLPINCLIIGWVNLAMRKFCQSRSGGIDSRPSSSVWPPPESTPHSVVYWVWS